MSHERVCMTIQSTIIDSAHSDYGEQVDAIRYSKERVDAIIDSEERVDAISNSEEPFEAVSDTRAYCWKALILLRLI